MQYSPKPRENEMLSNGESYRVRGPHSQLWKLFIFPLRKPLGMPGFYITLVVECIG